MKVKVDQQKQTITVSKGDLANRMEQLTLEQQLQLGALVVEQLDNPPVCVFRDTARTRSLLRTGSDEALEPVKEGS